MRIINSILKLAGYKVVPLHPTREMIDAGLFSHLGMKGKWSFQPLAIYEAMVGHDPKELFRGSLVTAPAEPVLVGDGDGHVPIGKPIPPPSRLIKENELPRPAKYRPYDSGFACGKLI